MALCDLSWFTTTLSFLVNGYDKQFFDGIIPHRVTG